MIKQQQNVIPSLDVRPDSSALWKVSSFCQDCLCHLDVFVDFRGDGSGTNPCPNEQFPLHHFVLDVAESRASSASPQHDKASNEYVEYCFRCTSEQCRAAVTIRLRPPRLKPRYLTLLTDPSLLEARRKAAVDVDLVRNNASDFVTPTSTEALEVLFAYLRDSLDTSRPAKKRRVPVLNRRLMVTFGQDCNELLSELGFKYAVSVRASSTPPCLAFANRLLMCVRRTKRMVAPLSGTCRTRPRRKMRLLARRCGYESTTQRKSF